MVTVDVATLRPDLTDEAAQEARTTLTRWQSDPRRWGIFCRNAIHRRHHGRDGVFLFPVADEGYFRVFEAAKNRIVGDS